MIQGNTVKERRGACFPWRFVNGVGFFGDPTVRL